MPSTQMNFRIPAELKQNATKKAEKIGYNLNGIVTLFLYKFVQDDDLVEIKREIQMEKIFDRGIKSAFLTSRSKKKAQRIAKLLE